MVFLKRSALVFLCIFSWLSGSAIAADDSLGPGDSIRINVFQNPNLTTEARISPRGSIWFPLIGDVNLAGLSQGEAVIKIADLLKRGQYLIDPQVSISVLQVRSRQVSVLGQVVRPGRYPLDEGSTRLTDILALAGGITPDGDSLVTVIGHADGQSVRREIDLGKLYRASDPATNIELNSGDTLVVERAPVFYIYGQVLRAGAYRLSDKLNVMQALTLAGGMGPFGTERGIRIHRIANEGRVEAIGASLADNVRANDVIMIPESIF